MSGGSSGPGGPLPPPEQLNCEVVEKTQIQSPDPAIAMTIKVQDVLYVNLIESGRGRLEAVTPGGGVLGGLTPPSLLRLIRCIRDEGRSYEAVVDSINGGDIRVTIRPES